MLNRRQKKYAYGSAIKIFYKRIKRETQYGFCLHIPFTEESFKPDLPGKNKLQHRWKHKTVHENDHNTWEEHPKLPQVALSLRQRKMSQAKMKWKSKSRDE